LCQRSNEGKGMRASLGVTRHEGEGSNRDYGEEEREETHTTQKGGKTGEEAKGSHGERGEGKRKKKKKIHREKKTGKVKHRDGG